MKRRQTLAPSKELSRTPMLADAVDIRRWLQADRRTPYAERLARDRAIGQGIEARRDLDRVRRWWQQLPAEPDLRGRDEADLGHRVETGRRLASVALAGLGGLIGGAVGGVAFGYEGAYPVNLFTLLGVLVGLPLLLLVLTLLAAARLPGLKAVQTLAAGMSPGRWLGAWLDRVLGVELFAPGLLGGAASAFSRWQLVVFSQWLALGFFTGAIGVALALVTFTDLAFGWSTTLELDAARVHDLVAALSAPWAGWLPQAAPDASLVEASRYFRLEEARLSPAQVSRLGEWWPFVLMTVLIYGALPRVVLLALGAWRLRRATASLLLDDPEAAALLDRMDTPLVALGADSSEERLEEDATGLPPPVKTATADGLVLLIWNAAADAATARRWLATHLGAEPEAVAELGILQSEAEQRTTLAGAREAVDGSLRRVALVTKGWEPPLLEFLDFLGLLREELGSDCSITVVPLDVAGRTVRSADREVWARALARGRDPRLYVMDAGERAP